MSNNQTSSIDTSSLSSSSAPTVEIIQKYLEDIRTDLYGRVLPFWMAYSVDEEYGGFFNNLDNDGAVFDTHKHIWLQGRQCWMFARIANAFHSDEEFDNYAKKYNQNLPVTVPSKGTKTKVSVNPLPLTRRNLVRTARAGVQFLRDHAVRKSDGHIYFCLDRTGQPALLQRKPFSATFMIIALAEVGKATGEQVLVDEAIDLLNRVLHWIKTPGALGKESLPGNPPLDPLNVPMIILNIIGELARTVSFKDENERKNFYKDEKVWCAQEILKHVHTDKKVILESVRSDGSIDTSSPEGRLINPGHAIEAGWFLLGYGQETQNNDIIQRSLDVINWSWDLGWDKEYGNGGFLYFLDIEGFTPTQLEWNMKLWWPVAEAMVAMSMGYAETLDSNYWTKFQLVTDWTFEHLCDKQYGEWYGYSDRYGKITHHFKGGPYKGCFHVPRALFLCEQNLLKALEKLQQK